jgi:hypothetical protein
MVCMPASTTLAWGGKSNLFWPLLQLGPRESGVFVFESNITDGSSPSAARPAPQTISWTSLPMVSGGAAGQLLHNYSTRLTQVTNCPTNAQQQPKEDVHHHQQQVHRVMLFWHQTFEHMRYRFIC